MQFSNAEISSNSPQPARNPPAVTTLVSPNACGLHLRDTYDKSGEGFWLLASGFGLVVLAGLLFVGVTFMSGAAANWIF